LAQLADLERTDPDVHRDLVGRLRDAVGDAD
jgi:hypothetical protein